jgi:hypothetical protein
MSEHFLSLYVKCPTRGSNVLDIFLTNNDRLVTNVNSLKTELSDHNLADILLAWNPLSTEELAIPKFDENSFRLLDFSKTDFDALKEKLNEIEWSSLRNHCSFEEFPALFTDTLFQICQSCVPQKTVPSGRPKHLNALRWKKSRLKTRLDALIATNGNPIHIKNVKYKLAGICYDMKNSFNNELDKRENRAVEKIKTNPKYFYSYAKSLSKV